MATPYLLISTSDMGITIRAGVAEDVSATYKLIKELADFENEPNAVVISESDLLRDGFGSNPNYHLMVAEYNGKIIGIALYYYCYSTWRGKYLYLEDLIVTESFRRKGVGSKLFEALMNKTKIEGLKQMGWQVLDWNQPAIEFYKKYGALLDEEWINGRFYF